MNTLGSGTIAMRIKPQSRRRVRSTSWTNRPGVQIQPEAAEMRRGARPETHPLTRLDENQRLWAYEQRVKGSFDRIVPVLKSIAARVPDAGFEDWAQAEAHRMLGFGLPESLLADAWVAGLDRRALFAHAIFETVRTLSDDYFTTDPLDDRGQSEAFGRFLIDCGFHAMNVTTCSDGRLAHAIRYVLRLPMGAVRRRANAGALFDIEEALERWSEVELRRFREAVPNTADAQTRYLSSELAILDVQGFPLERQWYVAHAKGKELSVVASAFIDFLGEERARLCRQLDETRARLTRAR